ncbi:uncharacterized protein LOC114526287 isoform X3 [Dendronephthya gigantea]|uniref:uncharacterized protein LOC114526287 isoform X3 n=1 Tax=Dendronephthya gigantea TaxID=151771 RepID=UPI0010692FB6|nr:uncharacterized protein LOC114526287 isoform X3 [Dendronephthya gigantea]
MWDLLRADEIYSIMFFLSTKDVLRCLQVCKQWKAILSEQIFWKNYIRKRFDLKEITNEPELDGLLVVWRDREEWFCYYDDQDDPYVIRPFPSMLKCGVVVPFGLDPMSFDSKHLQGNECNSSESDNELSMVLIPWDNKDLPLEAAVFGDIFHFHPEILECAKTDTESVTKEKLYFHVDSDHCENFDHDKCLNGVFGQTYSRSEKEGQLEFFTWVQKIMVPSCNYIVGENKLNPVVQFFLTTLGPGWVGGILTCQIWT